MYILLLQDCVFEIIMLRLKDYIDVANKTILVIGTQTPWVEAILLNKKAKKVVTLEYGYFIRFAINQILISVCNFQNITLR